MIPGINDALSSGRKEVRFSGAMLTNIIKDRWKEGKLTLKVQWDNGDTTRATLRDLKEDHPRLFAYYLIAHDCSRRKKGSRDINLIWAKKNLQDYDKTIHRITRLYDFYLDENNDVCSARRAVINKGKRKRKPFREKPRYKYGVKIPQNVKEALDFGKENEINKCAEAMKLEIQLLNDLECFEFQPKDYSPAK